MVTIVLGIIAVLCLVASISWLRSGIFYYKHWQKLALGQSIGEKAKANQNGEGNAEDGQRNLKNLVTEDKVLLAKIEYKKSFHTFALYVLLAVVSGILIAAVDSNLQYVFLLLLFPVVFSIRWMNLTEKEQLQIEQQNEREKRVDAALTQDQLASRAWAQRLAPELLPSFEGVEIAQFYQAGAGLIAGDFYDVFKISDTRLAAVIGDVAGNGIDSSITAFQVKYLLRVFLRQFRDPAQALEELNAQLSAYAYEDFVSIVVSLFDSEARVLRYASAGHPTAWLWHKKDVHPMKSTGPVIMLDNKSSFYSREIEVEPGDIVLMYTDGLSEARKSSTNIFGEERVGEILKQNSKVDVDTMCKKVLEAVIDYSEGPINDDMAMLALRVNPDWTESSFAEHTIPYSEPETK